MTTKMEMPEIASEIWDMKYRHKTWDGVPIDQTVEHTWRRISKALAEPEAGGTSRKEWEARFYHVLSNYHFLPAGRIITGAGTDMNVTQINCYVMDNIDDSMEGILRVHSEAALTLQAGGGVGMDFSPLRPKGSAVKRVNSVASGPLPFMDMWDSMCKSIMSAGTRRGAMMGTLRCDHPDIEEYVDAKRDPRRFRNFNLSVLVTDAFMEAVYRDEEWQLSHPRSHIVKVVRAKDLWDRILKSTYDSAEPGVIFIDRINKMNNLAYCETINSTNPCGEQPLPPYGACLLGSINLASLVMNPFTDKAAINKAKLRDVVETAVRMLDNVIEVSRYPLERQKEEHKSKRRIGLGITGLADALVMCGHRYGSNEAAVRTAHWLDVITTQAYLTSTDLAEEKGAFPLYDPDKYMASEFINHLPSRKEILAAIAKKGIRNSHLTSIAPTGTISLYAGNISSGIEPIFALDYERKVLLPDGTRKTNKVQDYAVALYRHMYGDAPRLPDEFVTAQDLTVEEHIRMLAVAQYYVDSSVSKTVNCPEDMSFEDFKAVYDLAYSQGLKACATYRPNEITGSILSIDKPEPGEKQEPAPADPFARDASFAVRLDVPPPSRPRVLIGETFKLKTPHSDHAIYVTVNDLEEDGALRPYEIFINSKNMEHYQWTVGLTRMISAIFRRGGDVRFVVEELKAVLDPSGGFYADKKFVPSLLAALGAILEEHMIGIKYMEAPITSAKTLDDVPAGTKMRQCPKCGEASLTRMEGCDKCLACDYSKC